MSPGTIYLSEIVKEGLVWYLKRSIAAAVAAGKGEVSYTETPWLLPIGAIFTPSPAYSNRTTYALNFESQCIKNEQIKNGDV